MGACGCIRVNFENNYKDFFEKLSIRFTSATDWVTKVKINFDGKTKKIPERKWEGFFKTVLNFPDDTEISAKLFRKAFNFSEEKGGQYLLILSIIFLCSKNGFEAKKQFNDLAKTTFGFKEKFKEENNTILVEKEFLYNIVSFYVNLISLFSVEFLSGNAGNKKDFEEIVGKAFSLENQAKYLNQEIFKAGETTNINFINLDKFFIVEYTELSNDSLVREKLYAINESLITKK